MHTHVRARVRACAQSTYVRACACGYVRTHACACYVCTYVYTCAHTGVCLSGMCFSCVCMCTWACVVCTHVHMQVCICVHGCACGLRVHACACMHPQVHGHKPNATGPASALSPPDWQPDPGPFRTALAPEASGAGRERAREDRRPCPAPRSDVGATSLRTHHAAQGNAAGPSCGLLASHRAWALGNGHSVGGHGC